jgi:ATP-dependent Clp protease ATP-binding subunit ClpB
VQRVLQNPIASLILEGRIADGDKVHVGALEGGLTINGETVAMA